MILYTPLCETDIFPYSGEIFSKRQYISVNGKTLYVEQMDDGSYELLQLLSTNPQDYLDANFVPGTILKN